MNRAKASPSKAAAARLARLTNDSSAPLTFGMVDADGRDDAILGGVAYFAGGAAMPTSSMEEAGGGRGGLVGGRFFEAGQAVLRFFVGVLILF